MDRRINKEKTGEHDVMIKMLDIINSNNNNDVIKELMIHVNNYCNYHYKPVNKK